MSEPRTGLLTLFIQCPCGYWDEIEGVPAGDFARANVLARGQGWRFPRVNAAPLDGNGRMTGKGQCRECFLLECNG